MLSALRDELWGTGEPRRRRVKIYDMSIALSIAAITLSIISLGWQIWSWARSGPRIKVSVTYSAAVLDGFIGETHAVVQAVNSGRAAATVSGFGFDVPGGFSFVVTNPAPWSATLPCRMEPHSTASWHVSTEQLLAACRQNSIQPEDLRAFVNTATGKVHVSEPGVKLTDGKQPSD